MLKLLEFARLFAAMACVNLIFPPQKLNSNDTLQRDTRRFNAAFLIEFLQFLLCNLRTNVQIELIEKDSPKAS